MANIKIDDTLIRDIKMQADLIHVISQYTKLQIDGILYRGLCPFHEESSPSFVVYPPKDKNSFATYYCFGCHAGNKEETEIGNDVIAFIMAKEEVGFIDACQMLCDKFNIPYTLMQSDPEIAKLKKSTTDKNFEYYNNLLNNKLVLGYLQSRSVNNESITKWRMGLTPATEFPEWKRNRLVFGITDVNYEPSKANTVAMGYRCLMGVIKSADGMEYFPNIDTKSKYRNDAESKIFKKSKTLFGLNYAAKPIRRVGYAIVVEGYLDVVLMHQAGFENTVAPMGTSFAEDQMDMLKKYTNQLLFFMDADERGLESMRRVLPKLLERGFSVLIVEAPANMDPADLVISLGQGKAQLDNYIRNHSTPALQWSTKTALEIYESKVHKAKIDALKIVLPILDKVSHRESKIAYMSSIADRLGVDASLLLHNPEKVIKQEEEIVNKEKVMPVTMPVWTNPKK